MINFDELLANMSLDDIHLELEAAAQRKREAEERKAREQAELDKRAAEQARIGRITDIANHMLSGEVTAEDMEYIYSIWLPHEFPDTPIQMNLFDADALVNHANTTLTLFGAFQNLFAEQPNSKKVKVHKEQKPVSPDEAIRNFINHILDD